MKKDKLDDVFDTLQSQFDVEEPIAGHAQRFLIKLEKDARIRSIEKRKNTWWKPLSIAASLAVLLSGSYFYFLGNSVKDQVAKISPEASKTEFYFANLINDQVKQLKSESTPETQKIIEDTLVMLQKLENDYNSLEQDLVHGGNSKLILSAMIINFQTRIDLVKDVLKKIETIKTYKNNADEDYII
ncbi:hypothetical protein U1E44_02445 [Arenibacter sp. GZD96]|uniref:hypothetical protein n=1 Tax=Aurantibrevibacter litoralis TaxID=3106030 RepID=UPI002AFF781D|nr:hypothetical protein [Arenibacter sp. GZD-96]MEA1784938.1 hypothetical protein [Arenibacter sp. GZD-96]